MATARCISGDGGIRVRAKRLPRGRWFDDIGLLFYVDCDSITVVVPLSHILSEIFGSNRNPDNLSIAEKITPVCSYFI